MEIGKFNLIKTGRGRKDLQHMAWCRRRHSESAQRVPSGAAEHSILRLSCRDRLSNTSHSHVRP